MRRAGMSRVRRSLIARIREGLVGHVGHEPPGRDRVHLDVVARPLHAERARERDDAALGRAVDRVARQAPPGPRTEARLMTLPDRCAIRCGAAARQPLKTPVRFTSSRRRQSSGRQLGQRRDLGDAGVVDDDVEPAELGDRALHQRLDVGVARDVGGRSRAPGRPPASTSCAVSSSAAFERAASATSAPASASATAIARPRPRLAPVTTATLPASDAGPGAQR